MTLYARWLNDLVTWDDLGFILYNLVMIEHSIYLGMSICYMFFSCIIIYLCIYLSYVQKHRFQNRQGPCCCEGHRHVASPPLNGDTCCRGILKGGWNDLNGLGVALWNMLKFCLLCFFPNIQQQLRFHCSSWLVNYNCLILYYLG